MAILKYTQTFEQLVELCINHLSPYSSEKEVIQRIISIISRFEQVVKENPEATNISPYLSSLGINNSREFNADSFKILYRYEQSTHSIYVVAICAQKQDLQKLLIDYCLIYK